MTTTDQHTDDNGVIHRLEAETPKGFRARCAGCSYLWPCPAVRILPEPLLDGGEVLADLVDVGWSIYLRGPAGSDGPRPGGVVIGVDRPADPTLPAESYRVLDWQAGRPRFRTLALGEFDPMLSNPPNAAACRSAARRLSELVARHRGTATPEEVELARTAYVLLSAVA